MSSHEGRKWHCLRHRPNNVIIPPVAMLVASGDTTLDLVTAFFSMFHMQET